MELIVRQKYIDKIDQAFSLTPIAVLIGARQVGKTSIMKTYAQRFAGEQLLLNGQDPEVAALFGKLSDLETYVKAYLGDQMEGLLMIDEFQFITNVSTMLKLLVDKYDKLHILCTGSSSLDILQQVEESMAGRVRLIEVFSLSFEEYLLFRAPKLHQLHASLKDNFSQQLISPMQALYNDYLVYGGLPRVALATDPANREALLNDIYVTYLMNDVRHYVRGSDMVGFNRLLSLLATQIGDLANVNELSRESGLSYRNCQEYLLLLQHMYIIRLVKPYFTNKRKTISKMSKIYFCDLGLRNIIYRDFNDATKRADRGHLFENEICLELLRTAGPADEIFFYRTTSGTEVDFVVSGTHGNTAVECKFKHFDKPASITALNTFGEQEGISRRFVANANLDATTPCCRYIPGVMANRILADAKLKGSD